MAFQDEKDEQREVSEKERRLRVLETKTKSFRLLSRNKVGLKRNEF